MAAQKRIEYHWIENRVVPKTVQRPSYAKQWRFNTSDKTLIATIEPSDRSFGLREGPSHSAAREVDCIRIYRGVLVDDSMPDFSKRIPESIRIELKSKLDTALRSAPAQWEHFANEPDLTGHIRSALDGIVVSDQGWRIKISGWTYTPHPKEKEIGADLGVMFDTLHNGQRLIKASWYQAKIDRAGPLDDLADLKEQVVKMRKYTKEAYTLLYTPDEIISVRGLDRVDGTSFSENLVDGAICNRGDRDPLVIANTVDIKHVVTFFISGDVDSGLR
jgi:hypothetical protein